MPRREPEVRFRVCERPRLFLRRFRPRGGAPGDPSNRSPQPIRILRLRRQPDPFQQEREIPWRFAEQPLHDCERIPRISIPLQFTRKRVARFQPGRADHGRCPPKVKNRLLRPAAAALECSHQESKFPAFGRESLRALHRPDRFFFPAHGKLQQGQVRPTRGLPRYVFRHPCQCRGRPVPGAHVEGGKAGIEVGDRTPVGLASRFRHVRFTPRGQTDQD